MRSTPRWMWVVGVAVLVAVAAFLLLSRHGRAAQDEADAGPTARVTLAQVRSQSLSTVVHAYGTVQPAADAALTIASPKAAVVMRLFVGAGQAVRAGQPLLELADAPASQLAYKQAADAVAFAETDLARVRRMLTEHLVANDQVSAAEKTLADARAALTAQQAQGAGRSQTVGSPEAAVVTQVSAKAGDRVAQDTALLVLARSSRMVASLNLESGDSAGVAAGQTVVLTPAFGQTRFTSRLAIVGRQADPAARTVQATAPIAGDVLPVGAAVQAEITTGAHTGLTVPRAAVVFDETGTHIFTVSGGKAHRIFVTVGADHDQDVEVQGPLAPGAQVAVQGAYELQDGMSVQAAGR